LLRERNHECGIFHIRGQSHLEFRVDPQRCEKYGVQTADVNNVVSSALGAQPQTSMIEGEKRFDIAIRWPKPLRSSETSILDISADIVNNQVVLPQYPGLVPSAVGHSYAAPNPAGTLARADTQPLDKCLVQRHPDAELGKLPAAVSTAVNRSPIITTRKEDYSFRVRGAPVDRRVHIRVRRCYLSVKDSRRLFFPRSEAPSKETERK
jgi:multidrug efflux pump subunit AcrB